MNVLSDMIILLMEDESYIFIKIAVVVVVKV